MRYLLPVSYLGPIEYYAFLIQKEDVLIESKEYFIKQSIRNRCQIYGSNGLQTLSIPKERKSSSKTIISDIKISNDDKWQKHHYNTIKSAYGSSPFFEYYIDDLQRFYLQKHDNLFNFNLNITKKMLEYLKVEKDIKVTLDYIRNFKGYNLRDYNFTSKKITSYPQVFEEKHGFIPHLSLLDLLFNLGPETTEYLEKLSI